MRQIPANEDISIESLLGQAADDFTQRCVRGEQPSIEEYAARYPQIAAVIREVFPALQGLPAPVAQLTGPEHGSAVELPAAGILGDYRLIRELGRGGMGVVYEAEQISLGRRVALKVLSFAAVLDQKQLQRFKNEAQAAAQLHHTNIVPVFSVGSERGVHYYAMQYIEGHPLSAVIRELRQLGGLEVPEEAARSGRDSKASVRTATTWMVTAPLLPAGSSAAGLPASAPASGLLESIATEGSLRGHRFFHSTVNLAVQAAEALQHAHERGVIHRDIKPSNLLLDTDGRLWITDFGLALVQADPGLTLTGDLLGTIRYMSPEQALAKRVPVDHRTDIYSLGVTFYEMLTLEPAFTGGDRQELLRQIAFEEPRPPRRINHAIPRELEIIVGKAMAKNPDERYGTAQELADDLRRFLEDRPILARPPTLLNRAAKWSRRHQSVVAASIILLFLSVAGLSVSTVMIARERAKAVRERDAAQAQKTLAEKNLQSAREVLDRMLMDGSAIAPDRSAEVEQLRLTLQLEALEAARAGTEKSRQPAARREWGSAQMRVGQTYAQLGQETPAEQAYRQAIAIFEKLLHDVPDVAEDRVELAKASVCLGTLLWQKRRYAESETLARQGHTLLTDVVNRFPEPRPYRQQLAGSLDLLGLVLRDSGRLPEAETSIRESIRLRGALIAEPHIESAERPQQILQMARTERNLADLLLRGGRRDEAEETIRKSIAAQEHLATVYPDDAVYAAELARTRRWWDEVVRLAGIWPATATPEAQEPGTTAGQTASGYSRMLAETHQTLTEALEGTGDPEAATAAYHQAVAQITRMARESPTEARYREDLVDLHRKQAVRMRELWQMDDAETAFQKSAALLEQLLDEFPDRTGYRDRLEQIQAKLDIVRGRKVVGELMRLSSGSVEDVARAVELAGLVDVAAIAANPHVLTICADHLSLGGDFVRAEQLARAATELEPDSNFSRRALGWALLGLGRTEEAQAALRQIFGVTGILSAERAVRGCPEPSTAVYLLDLVSQERYVNRWQGVSLFGSRFDPWPWFWVGMRMELEGRLAEAEAAYRNCEALGRVPKAHYTTRWAAYRLQMLTGGP